MKIYATNVEAFEKMQEDEWTRWIDLLDSPRRKRISELKQRKDRIQCLGAGLLLRYSFLTEGYKQEQWEEVKIHYGASGKPMLVQYPAFCYSLSHSGKWVICGVHSKELGVDIQEMRPWNQNLAKRFFSLEEYERLLEADESQVQSMFYKMWTAKESYAKLTGDGIGKGIHQYLTSASFDKVTDTDCEREAKIRVYEMMKDYMICVSVKDDDEFPNDIQIISVEELK